VTSVALAIVLKVGQLEIKTMMHQMPAPEAGGVGYTKTAAEKVARFGITVNPICPNAATAKVAGVPPDKLAEFTAAVPIGRPYWQARRTRRGSAGGRLRCQCSGRLDPQYRAAGRRQHADVAGSPARQGVCGR
jgi:NAD(P)-dependent dehydrogenase (short-subunit alcohol dehydrogenase family)